jgi:hypothetical protein
MISSLISLLIYLLVVGIILWLALYVISVIPLPPPFAQVARVIIIVIGCLIVILLLLQLVGSGTLHIGTMRPLS